MRKLLGPYALLILVSLSFLAGCMKDSYKTTIRYTYYIPVYKTAAAVKAAIKGGAPREVVSPGKLFIKGNYIFLNEIDKGIHIIDNSDAAHPRNIAFIDIPGNMDIAVKGSTLYADLYTDLVAIDITDPSQVVLKKVIENVFPHRYYETFRQDSSLIIASWEKRDTTITSEQANSGFLRRTDILMSYYATANGGTSSASPYGMGGSMARFTIVQNYLYTVGFSTMNIFNISSGNDPVWARKEMPLGNNVETIFPFQDKIFIGTSNGVMIYKLTNPENPTPAGVFAHVTSCDPVIADGNYAYATLRAASNCNRGVNALDVIDVSTSQPILTRSYPQTNPHGLSKDGDLLFVCDGTAGLFVYDAHKPEQLAFLNSVSGIETYDVIAYQGRAIVVAKDGLYQYTYTAQGALQLLSKINITK